MQKVIIYLLFLNVFTSNLLIAQDTVCSETYRTYVYKTEDTTNLLVDVFLPFDTMKNRTCILYLHGGGFMGGKRHYYNQFEFYHYFASQGVVVTSMSYRYTMKDKGFNCRTPAKEKIHAFREAAIDINDCVDFLLRNATALGIDSSKIIIAGSSAGAEACLHAAYMPLKKKDRIGDENFRFAGVISMAGALADTSWITRENAIPTLLFHGTCDKLVPYGAAAHHYCDEKRPGYLMLYGGHSIMERLRHLDRGYYLYTLCNGGHEISGTPLTKYLPEMMDWINNDVEKQKLRQIHIIEPTDKKSCDLPQFSFCNHD